MMFAERLQIQKFIMLSLLAHLIFAGLMSAVQISVPFPAERPLQVRIVDQPAPTAIRPPLDPRNLGQFSGRAQRPAEKEGPARTPDSSGIPGLESARARPAPPSLLPAPVTVPEAPGPRTIPAPSIPSPSPMPPRLAEVPQSAPYPQAAPGPRTIPAPSIPPPARVGTAPASPAGEAEPVPPPVLNAQSSERGGKASDLPRPPIESAGKSREGKAAQSQGSPPAFGSEAAAKGVPTGRASASEPKVGQGGRSAGDGVEGPARLYDLRGQVAMLWKSLDPRKYPYQDADVGEEGDTGSPTERTVSLDSQDSRFASYLLGVKRRIENLWGYPPEARGLTGNLAVTFAIMRDGRLTDLQLTETSGIAPLDNEAIRAIREAAPFAPFPERMRFERLNIRAAFYYYASRSGLRGR